MRNFKFYNDPGHGWVAVKRDFLKELGILEKITDCSYQRGNSVYLEEDCDATAFVNAYKAKFNDRPVWIDKYCDGRSAIRSYERFSIQGE